MAETVRLHVGGPIISWPDLCPCCLGPADAQLDISHRQVDVGPIQKGYGYRQQRVTTKTSGMSAPYCKACLTHDNLARQIQQKQYEVRESPKAILTFPVIPILVAGALAAAGFGGTWYLWKQAGDFFANPWPYLGAAGCLLVGIFGALMTFGVVHGWRTAPQALAEAKARHAQRMQELQALEADPHAKPKAACSGSGLAVRFQHLEQPAALHFTFENGDYARQFRAANRDRLLT